ncbi:MAG TPA: hypothetical protein ENI68_08520 [Gammaproteobacteria bacterium]|nr:hypothetical protein [Gammaproteobacteria bacterium]
MCPSFERIDHTIAVAIGGTAGIAIQICNCDGSWIGGADICGQCFKRRETAGEFSEKAARIKEEMSVNVVRGRLYLSRFITA